MLPGRRMSGRTRPSPATRAAAAAGLIVLIGGGVVLSLGPGGITPTPAPRPGSSVPAATGGDLFVDPAGDDAAIGDRTAPLATVDAALTRAPAGATIWLLPGRHTPFAIGQAGARPITIAGTVDGGSVVAGGDAQAAIRIDGTSGVTLLDLAVDGPAGSARAGVLVERSSAVRMENLTVSGVRGGFGIHVRFSADVTIEGSDISHNAVGVRLFGEGDPGSVHDITIAGNWIHDSDSMVVDDPAPDNDFGGNGIIWHKVGGPTVARDNQLWNNAAHSHDYGTDGGAFEIWGSSGVTITGNTAWDNVNVLESGTDGPPCTRLTFLRNTAFGDRGVGLILRCAEAGLVAHNVLAGLRGYAFELSDGSGGNRFASSVDGLRILDNIVADVLPYAIRNDIAGSVTADRNVLWNPRGSIATLPDRGRATSLPAFVAATGLDAESVEEDPLFVDAPNRDYRLRPGSPAIDLGEVVDDAPYVGEAPDAGRYELEAASPARS